MTEKEMMGLRSAIVALATAQGREDLTSGVVTEVQKQNIINAYNQLQLPKGQEGLSMMLAVINLAHIILNDEGRADCIRTAKEMRDRMVTEKLLHEDNC